MISALALLLSMADAPTASAASSVDVNITLVQAGSFLPKSVTDNEFRGAVLNVVRDEGGSIVNATDAPATCVAPECFERLAAPGATHVLVVEGKRITTSSAPEYTATVSLWSLAKRDFVGRDTDAGCKVCVGQELVQKVAGRVRRLVIDERTRLRGEALAAAVPSTVPPAATKVTPAPVRATAPKPAASTTSRDMETSTSWIGSPWVAGGIIGVGVAAVAGGAYLLHLDGRDADCNAGRCWNRYQTASRGYGLIGAGVVVGAVGGWRLWTAVRS